MRMPAAYLVPLVLLLAIGVLGWLVWVQWVSLSTLEKVGTSLVLAFLVIMFLGSPGIIQAMFASEAFEERNPPMGRWRRI